MFVKSGSNWSAKQVKSLTIGKTFPRTFLQIELTTSMLIKPPYGYRVEDHDSEYTKAPVQITMNFWHPEDSMADVFKDGSPQYSDILFNTETNRDYPPEQMKDYAWFTASASHPWFRTTVRGLSRPEGIKLGKWEATLYLCDVHRFKMLDVTEIHPQPKKPLHEEEQYMFWGYNNAIIQYYVWEIPLYKGETPLMRETSHSFKPKDGGWQK